MDDEGATHRAEDAGSALADLAAAIDGLAALHPWQLSASELSRLLLAVEIAGRRVAAIGLAAVGEVDRRGTAGHDPGNHPGFGASDQVVSPRGVDHTAGWLRGLLALSPAEARRRVSLAQWLSDEGTGAAAAIAHGEICAEHAQIIHRTMSGLGNSVDPQTRAESLAFLLDHAAPPHDPAPPDDPAPPNDPAPLRGFDPMMLARLAARLRHRLDPDAGERLAKDQDRWEDENTFSVGLDPHGRGHLSGVLDPVSTGQLLAALDPLTKPRPATPEVGYDPRPPGLRRAQALMVLVNTVLGLPEHRGGALPSQAGARPRMLVTVPFETLAGPLIGTAGTDPAITGRGQILAARTAQQLACIAEIVPVLLDPDGCPLDVGQSVYAFPDRIRRAIEARDHGCTYPGCGAPAPWCHTHHLTPFSRGGSTSVTNGALLCGRHHRHVHAQGWTGVLVDGRVTWHPPDRPSPTERDPYGPVAATPPGLANPDHIPLPVVQHALDELTRRWISRNPSLGRRAGPAGGPRPARPGQRRAG